MTTVANPIFRILCAGAAGILTFLVVNTFVLSTFNVVEVGLWSERDTEVKLYYTPSRSISYLKEKRCSDLVPLSGGEKRTLRFVVNNASIKTLRLDPGRERGTYRIYSIELYSFFGDPVSINVGAPENRITPSPSSRIQYQNNVLHITSTENDPFVIFHEVDSVQNNVLRFALPLFVAFLAYFTAKRFRLKSCHFWKDTFNRRPSSGVNYYSLDGLRGLAAIFVLATHAGVPGCKSYGIVGVVVFFTLSGFLLVIPYAKDSSKVMSGSYVREYFLRRFKRIVPMFYFYLVLAYLFNDRLGDFIRSALFLQGHNILWAVLQEVHFYLLLPLFFLVNHMIFRGKNFLIWIFLLFLGLGFSSGLLPTHRMYGNGVLLSLYAGIFLSGMAASYFAASSSFVFRPVQKVLRFPLTGVVLFLCLPCAGLIGAALNSMQFQDPSWLLRGYYSYLICFFILTLLASDSSVIARALRSTPLRLVGTVSYSFYLLHPGCLKIVREFIEISGVSPNPLNVFALAFTLTFLLSTVTYSLIERPFVRGFNP